MGAFEPIEVQRGRCEKCRDALRELTRIHVKIDAPRRNVRADAQRFGRVWLRQLCRKRPTDSMTVQTMSLLISQQQWPDRPDSPPEPHWNRLGSAI